MRRGGWLVLSIAIGMFVAMWWLAAIVLDAAIILPSPWATLSAMFSVFSGAGFLPAVVSTIGRGALGFAVSFALGLGLGIWAGLSKRVATFLHPYIVILRSTPLIAVILLALIWFRSSMAPVFVCFLMVFPVVFTNVQAGITAVDPELLEMTEVYRVDRGRVLRYLYLPSILPFLLSGIQTGLGLTWKVVVAAEVLSEPRFGIGASLSDARILLDTPRVFAWTAVAILLSAATDALFGAIRRGRRL